MNDNDVQSVGIAIERAGAMVVMPIPCVGGTSSIRVFAHDLADYIRDPETFTARMLNVTPMQLQAWKVEGGVPKCGADTKWGAPCKNSVSPHVAVEPASFASLHRQDYCHHHAG